MTIKSTIKPNTTQTTLPTAPDQHNDMGSMKIELPTSSKYGNPLKKT